MNQLALGLNRWDWRGVRAFADSVAEGEAFGIDYAFQPVNPLSVQDPYILLAAAGMATSTIKLGPLLETPMLRPAPVAAGSIATLDELTDGRAMLVYGVGDTAVRFLGRRPARIAELEQATKDARTLLAGQGLDVGTGRPARLQHARSVPVWLAAGGPKTLRMAGRVADGVFLRVGTHPANIRHAVDQLRLGIDEAGRSPSDVSIGLIVHTCRTQDPAEIRAITRAMAAGFYEYEPALFDPPGFEWTGPHIRELKKLVDPDFHHARDLVAAGSLVDFLADEVAASFSFFGATADIADQVRAIRAAVPEIDLLVPHPVPMAGWDELRDYAQWVGQDLKPRL